MDYLGFEPTTHPNELAGQTQNDVISNKTIRNLTNKCIRTFLSIRILIMDTVNNVIIQNILFFSFTQFTTLQMVYAIVIYWVKWQLTARHTNIISLAIRESCP